MSKFEEIKKRIDNLYYWDMPALNLSCNYFADEVILSYKADNGIVKYYFTKCYESKFQHGLYYQKPMPSKDLIFGQIPYFIQKITLEEVEKNGDIYYHCYIDMPPLSVEILCKELEIKEEEDISL